MDWVLPLPSFMYKSEPTDPQDTKSCTADIICSHAEAVQ